MRSPFLSGRDGASRMRWVVAVWIGFTVAAVIKVLVQPTVHTVYPVFAEAAKNWWQDVSLYLPSPERDLFRYSPTFAVLMSPFGLLPDRLGGVLWLVANVALLLAVLHWAAGEVFPGLDQPDREAIWLGLTLVGSARSLWAGQSNSLVLATAIGAMLAIGRGRWWIAAGLLTGGGFIKVWPWALALLAGACWPRQLVLRMLVMTGLWAAVPFLTRAPETVLWQYQQWGEMLNTTQMYRWGGYRDAWTLWEWIQFPVSRDLYELVQCESALAVLAWCLWQRWHLRSATPAMKTTRFHSRFSAEEDRWRVGTGGLPANLPAEEPAAGESSASGFARMATSLLSAWAAWQLLFGPASERLTYIVIAPMVSWAVLESFRSGRYRALALMAWILISLFSMGAFERLVLKIIPWAPALLPLGVGVFVLWMVLHETAPGPIWPKKTLKELPGP